ncbi:MAG TPA: Smr/MutS family protein [Acetobacteraceae bacterium]|nr:Smr/MutS family protein [Acetobacteraceae bacterium]
MPEASAEPPPPSPAVPVATAELAKSRPRRPIVVAPLAVGAAPAGVDAASWHRLRSGRLVPERSLDLHGRTAEVAFHALTGFLQRAHADRVRCVEVITGRGAGPGGGVIRRELPVWLNLASLRPLVLGAVHPHPANPGAVRLLLRRQR